MDIATPVGIGVGFAAILVSMLMDGSSPTALIAPSSLLLIFGGTVGVSLAGVTIKDAKGSIAAFKAALFSKPVDPTKSIQSLVGFAELARREGMLALESRLEGLDDPFLRKGVQLAVDGTEADHLRAILERDLMAMHGRHKAAAKFFTDMGGYAPTIGIIGTVLGLIHVLGSLSSPKTIGPLIAGAFTATLWGVMSANVIWLPIANKLKRAAELELHAREMIIDGILAIQSGDSPRKVEQQLLAYLPPRDRDGVQRDRLAA